MLENRIAIIGKQGAGCGTLALEIEDRIKKEMDIFHIKGVFCGWYDLHMWDRKFMEMTPTVLTVDSEYEKHFQEGCKDWKGIVLLVDGEAFAVQAEDRADYKDQVSRRLVVTGQLDMLSEFMKADKTWELPPVCINVTKMDLIEECWDHVKWSLDYSKEDRRQKMTEMVHEIIQESYKIFFDETFPKRYGAVINLSAGRIYAPDKMSDAPCGEGFDIRQYVTEAKHVEHVMFFMIYSALAVVMDQKRKAWDAVRTEYQGLEGKLFKKEKVRQRMCELVEQNNQLKADAYYIRLAADTISSFWEDAPRYYIPGMEQTVKTYLWVRTMYFDFDKMEFSKYNDRYFDGISIH